MSDIELHLTTGQVSVIYFVFLEIFAITLVDYILIHVGSILWYWYILRGTVLEVKTAEIPGVANSLVGPHSAPPNVIAYVVKFAVLGIILGADVNIKSSIRNVVEPDKRTLTGTYIFNASNNNWASGYNDKPVINPVADVRGCFDLNPKAETIQFYHIRFNLTQNREADELGQEPGMVVNDSSIVCMKGGRVMNHEQNKLLRINGCSRHRTSKCTNETVIQFSYNLTGVPFQSRNISLLVFTSQKIIHYIARDYTSEAANIFDFYNNSNYSNSTLLCMTTRFSNDNRERETTIGPACIVTAVTKRNGEPYGTLVERWMYDWNNGVFSRQFPGPIFDRLVDFSISYKSIVLQKTAGLGHLSWESFSALLIEKGAVYQNQTASVANILGTMPTTVLPIAAVVLSCALFLSTVIGSIVVYFTIAKDTKPKINTLDGLSSIAREETEPTGWSLRSGRAMSVGLSKRNVDEVHFGPLRSNDVRVKFCDARNLV